MASSDSSTSTSPSLRLPTSTNLKEVELAALIGDTVRAFMGANTGECETEASAQVEDLHLPTPKRYLTETDLAQILGCSVRALRQRKNRPPSIKLSPRKRIFDPADVEAWLRAQPRVK